MTERAPPAVDWATGRRGSRSASRLVAAALLHLLALTALVLGTDRLRLPSHGRERATTLVTVTLAPLPIAHAPAPLPPPARVATARERGLAGASGRVPAPAHAPEALREPPSDAITLPARTPPAAVAAVATAATPPASAPSAPLADLMNAATTRAAIRDAARGTRLSERANDATHEDAGSAMRAADGSDCPDCTRNLAAARAPAERMKQGVASASRPDCLKMSSAAGLLALPLLAYAEAAGKCGN